MADRKPARKLSGSDSISRLDFCDDQEEDEKAENVQVMIRCRPLLKHMDARDKVCVRVSEENCSVEVDNRSFYFDAVFGLKTNNETVYMKSVRRLVEFAFKGYNCTVFLYGQTGTGKTFTHSSLTTSAFAHLFSLISDSNTQSRFLIRTSYCELYNEDVRDLLSNSRKALELRESKSKGVYVKDLSCFLVNNLSDIERLKTIGDKQRATGSTKMNQESSRSHSIFTITIETVDKPLESTSAADKVPSTTPVRVGRIDLVDLAGSERQAKSKSSGQRLKEASKINLSLTCLSLVIRALTDPNATHIPYRNSKLTRLLSSSLGGNSKTLLLACVSPAKASLDETLNTLRFASRAKKIKNKAKINEDIKDALLRKYRRQIEELRNKLKASEEDTMQIIDSHSNEPGQDAESGLGVDNNLLDQLRMLKNKIMFGGENLLDKVELHEKLLESSRLELEQKKAEEIKLKEKLEEKQEAIEKMRESRGTLEDQLVNLNQKIEKAMVIYKNTKNEFQDLSAEHSDLKENLLVAIKEINKEIKYADCIIDDYIPRNYQDLLNSYAKYDDESEEWQIKYIAFSGNNVNQTKKLLQSTADKNLIRNKGKEEVKITKSSQRPSPYIKLL